MKYAGLSLLAFAISIFLFPFGSIPETLLIVSYLIVSIQLFRICKQTQRRWLVIGLCSSAIVLHMLGFKLYGKPVLADMESLHNPRRAIGVEPPNLVLLADGTSTPMSDVFVPRKLDFTVGTTNNYGVFVDDAGIHRTLYLKIGEQQWPEIEITTTASNTVAVTTLKRSMYCCGNTWFPSFFPSRLPNMVRKDFRLALIEAGAAYPSVKYAIQATEENPVWDELIQSLRQRSLYDVPAENQDIEALALALLSNQYNFELGIDLLVETKSTNSIADLMTRLENIQIEFVRQNKRTLGPKNLSAIASHLEARLGSRTNQSSF